DAIANVLRETKPDVVVAMLSSEASPYTAVSTGTRGVVRALREVGGPRAIPFISIASWGLGPTEPDLVGFFSRSLLGAAQTCFWRRPFGDFQTQLAEVEQAKNEGLIRPIIILPPILTSGPKTNTYLSGEASAMKDVMGVTSSVSRESVADLCLKLGE